MTPKQARFVVELALHPRWTTAKDATIRAGYSPKSARQYASELRAKPHIAVLLSALRDARHAKHADDRKADDDAWHAGYEAGRDDAHMVHRIVYGGSRR